MDLDAAWIGPAVTATLISSSIAAIGWYVSWRNAVGMEDRRRQGRVRDVQTALLAEIRSIVHHLRQYDTSEIADTVRARLAFDPAHSPFISREAGSPLFQSVAGEISILPNSVIDQVVLFYRQHEVISHFADDLRGDRFTCLPAEQKMAMIDDYLALRDFAATLGIEAENALRSSLSAGLNRSGAVP